MAWNRFRSLGFVLADGFKKLDKNKDALDFCLLCGVRNGHSRRRNKTLQDCQRQLEGRILQVGVKQRRMLDEEENQLEGQRDSGWVSSGNGEVLWQERTNTGRHTTPMWDAKRGNRRPGRAKTRWADAFRRVAAGQRSRSATNRIDVKFVEPVVQTALT